MVTTCAQPTCSKSASVMGLQAVTGVTCSSAECIGIPKNEVLPNPDTDAIQIMNGTPGVPVTAKNFDASRFTPLTETVKGSINALCDDKKQRWLGVGDKVTTKSLLPNIKEYCLTPSFKNSHFNKDALLLIYEKDISMAERIYRRYIVNLKRSRHNKSILDNLDKPVISAVAEDEDDGAVIQTKREARKSSQNAKYHSNAAGLGDKIISTGKKSRKEKRDKKVAATEAFVGGRLPPGRRWSPDLPGMYYSICPACMCDM